MNSDNQQKVLTYLFIIIIIGAFLRVTAGITTQIDAPLRADAGQYFSYAYNLRFNDIYSLQNPFLTAAQDLKPDAMRTPGYPLFLSMLIDEAPTGETLKSIFLIQSLLGVLLIPITFLIGRQLLPSAWPLLPSTLVAISPQLVNAGTYILTESLFTLLLGLSLLSLVYQFKYQAKWQLPIISGTIIAAAALTRPTVQYFIPFFIICTFLLSEKQYRWRNAILLCTGFALLYAPWLIRNIHTLGINSDPTLTISTLIHGHYPNLMFNNNPESLGYPYRLDPDIAKLSVSVSSAIDGILARVMQEPATYMQWYLLGKPISFFAWSDAAGPGDIFIYPPLASPYLSQTVFIFSKSLMESTHSLLIILALSSLVVLIIPRWRTRLDTPSRHTLQILATLVMYFVAIHMIGFPIARYNMPILPALYIMASFTIVFALKAGASALQRKKESLST